MPLASQGHVFVLVGIKGLPARFELGLAIG